MRIVSVRGRPSESPGIVYCGRACGGWPASPLANPFPLTRAADRPVVLNQYRAWLWERIAADDRAVVSALLALGEGDTLGCWCVDRDEPAPDGEEVCHCEIIVKVARLLWSGA